MSTFFSKSYILVTPVYNRHCPAGKFSIREVFDIFKQPAIIFTMATRILTTVTFLLALATAYSFAADDSEPANIYYQSGLAAFKQNKFDEAIVKFTKAVTYRPEFPEALFKLGECYEKVKDSQKALFNYRGSVKYLQALPERTKEENDLLVQANRCVERLDIGGRQFQKIKTDYVNKLLSVAQDCFKKRYYHNARQLVERILALDPTNKSALELQAKLAGADTQPAKTGSKPARTAFERGENCMKNGEWAIAVTQFDEAIRQDSKYTEAYRRRGIAYYNQGKYDRTYADCSEALQLNPKDVEALLYRGHVHQQKGECAQAIAEYTAVLRLDPKNIGAYGNRGIMHWQKGELDLALADYGRALKIDPKYGPAYCNRALIYAQRQNYKAAIAEGEKFIKYNPKHPDVPRINALISQWYAQIKQ